MARNETPGALAGAAGGLNDVPAEQRNIIQNSHLSAAYQYGHTSLLNELDAAVRRRTPAVCTWATARWRIPSGADAAPWGVGRIEPLDHHTYQPLDGGEPAVIVPVIEDRALVDLVAFRPAVPGRWWTRRDVAVAVGADRADFVRWRDHDNRNDPDAEPLPLPILADPLAWLRTGGGGLVILDWRHARVLLSGVAAVACQTADLACRLHRALSEPHDMPAIYMMEDLRHAA